MSGRAGKPPSTKEICATVMRDNISDKVSRAEGRGGRLKERHKYSRNMVLVSKQNWGRTSNSLSPLKEKSIRRLDDNLNLHPIYSFLRCTITILFLVSLLVTIALCCRHPERFPDESSEDNSNDWGQRHSWLFSSRRPPKACCQVNPHLQKVLTSPIMSLGGSRMASSWT